MSARIMLAVELTDDDDGAASLRVEHDPDAEPSRSVDVRAVRTGDLIVSCSLDDLEEFAGHLVAFIEHHRLIEAE